MKVASRIIALRLFAAFVLIAVAVSSLAERASAQTGAIAFTVRATPASGIDEPVRGFPFYLLTESYEQIHKEAAAVYPPPDMSVFIDKLDVSKELKAWMKKNHWVQLSGEDFLKKLKPEDIVAVPEFYAAYLERSNGAISPDFPKAKYKPVDKTKNPEKYQKLLAEYHEAIEHYIEQNPQSKDGMDLNLIDTDPNAKWQELVAKRAPEIRQRAMELAQSKYFVARMETDLEGQGFIDRVPPGTYWLSTLDLHAEVGDVRPQWDVPVTVSAGQTAQVALSNVNAIQPAD
jgi:hypothetical protein